MQGYERYAIYYAPEAGSALGAFGNSWLGFDPQTGEKLSRPVDTNCTDTGLEKLTSDPARYGFHGTLKPPFALHLDYSIFDLDQALQDLAQELAPIVTGPLSLKQIGQFLCLCPTTPFDGLNNLAAAIVQKLDHFRGVQSEEQLAKRRARGLSDRQEAYLQQYGYPYVLEEFRFHLTLTNSLTKAQIELVKPFLEQMTEALTMDAFKIRELCLFADPGKGQPFELLKRYSLTGGRQ
ncbi:MAG: DUF1045 domain-containing protein [Sneathiella sp.]|nr:DUF1045 domain-containing protein [Sneathiella sp.]